MTQFGGVTDKDRRKDKDCLENKITYVINKVVYKELDNSLVRAATIASSLEAEQDSGNLIKTWSKKLEKKGGVKNSQAQKIITRVGDLQEDISDEKVWVIGDASKQGRKIDDIDKDAEITLVDETQGMYGDDLMFDTSVLDEKEVFAEQDMAEKDINVAEKEVSTADPVTTIGDVVTYCGC
ncbi:hypothetical protein Tco_0453720 [Tanacetum coccineum]